MAQEQPELRILPPYVPYKTFRTFVDGLRVAMPSRIDRSLMGTMSGATQGQLISALRYLDLITENGAPTTKLKELAKAEGKLRQDVVKEIVDDAYVEVFKDDLVDVLSGTYRQLYEAFAATGATGDTIRKCIAFWLLMEKESNQPVSPHFMLRGTRSSSRAPTKKRRAGPRERDEEDDEDVSLPSPVTLSRTPFDALMEKFPSFDPAWESEVQAKWFEAFERLRAMSTQEQ